MKPISIFLILIIAAMVSSCESTGTGGSPEAERRAAMIAAEPRGDYFIGRRYHVETTRFWGYLREPGKPWATAKLVMMNESQKTVPDRLPELPSDGGLAHGYDNNSEYIVRGRYTGRGIYDPNSNLVLPEFLLSGMDLKSSSPGYLFSPKEKYKPGTITIYPPGGIKEKLN